MRSRVAAPLFAFALGLVGAPGPAHTQDAPASSEPAPPPSPSPASEAPAAPPAAATHPRGLWVLCEGSQRVLEHPEKRPRLIADAKALGVSDLFVQVYRGGRAWFDSSLADAAPYRAMREAQGGDDPLRSLIAEAHAAGLRVHAWVNVLNLAGNRGAPIALALGRPAVQVDRRGRSLLDLPDFQVPEGERRFVEIGTPGLWLDPGAPGVADRVAAVLSELAARYPELDGLHLDYIRYPDVIPFLPGSRFAVGLDFGYGEATRARFLTETGLVAPFDSKTANPQAWDEWRRDRVTEIVRRARDATRAARPGMQLSAAVWFSPERSILSIQQDWPRWIDEDLVDFAVPMLYTTDPQLLRTIARGYVGLARDRIWVGLGSWLFAARPDGAADQLREVARLGLAGSSLFSWDAIAESPGLREAIAAEARRGD